MTTGEANPDCIRCDGTGFVVLIDYYGPGEHDEDNCPCVDDACDCEPCVRCRTLREETHP